MDGLRSDTHASDEDVGEVSSAKDAKTALTILYKKLTLLTDEGLQYFVEDVLPDQEHTDVLQYTLRSCPGPGKCSVKRADPHVPGPDTSAAFSSLSAPVSFPVCLCMMNVF